MKLLSKPSLLFFAALVLLRTDVVGQDTRDITLHVVDENGGPVEDARAVISFVGAREDDERIGPTDADGRFSAQGRVLVGVYLAASKEGHYPARFDSSRSDRLSPGNRIEKLFVLPRVLRPEALFAKRSGGWSPALMIPPQVEWFSYDFEVGDWLSPQGKGKTADIQFRFQNSFRGYDDSIKNLEDEIVFSKRVYAARREDWTEEKFKLRAGKWDGELEISFPGEKEGLYEEKDRFLPYSKMKMPHEAPAEGYQPTWRYTANTYSPTTFRTDVGFFLRTRVKLDEDGKIISANYTKVIGDFEFAPANGVMQFFYYFNPRPNDRNLEFDPKRNLFPANFPGANVGDP